MPNRIGIMAGQLTNIEVRLKDAINRVINALNAVNSTSETGLPETHPLVKSMREDLTTLCEILADLGNRNPLESSPELRQAAEVLAENPVFIGGVHKSGTTLLRNLLDGHSNLLVLPTDGKGYNWIETQLGRKEGESLLHIPQEIIRQMITPLGGTPPNWVLSEQAGDIQTYLEFAQYLFYWQRVLPDTLKGTMLTTVYAFYCTLSPSSALPPKKYWVEKSTRNADNAEALFNLFPRAKCIHIVRHPAAVISAQKRKEPMKGRQFNIQREIENWQKVIRLGLRDMDRLGPEVYHVIRYEDLVTNTAEVMKGIMNFLELPFEDILLIPTINGYAASSNTAHKDLAPDPGKVAQTTIGYWRENLTPAEIKLVDKYLAPLMESFGYQTETKSLFQRFTSLIRVNAQG